MKPIDFKGSNAVYAKDQPEYLPLPALKMEDGIVVSCWHMSFWERIKLLFTGNVWLMLHTFNGPLHPVYPTVTCPFAFKEASQTVPE